MLPTYPIENRKKSKKESFLILIALIAVSAILLSGFWVSSEFHPASTPVVEPIHSASGYYLLNGGNASRIFVVSANATYGSYPFPSATGPTGSELAQNGEPCVIINVTIRNDYSTQYPAPNPAPFQNDPAFAYVFLTAHLFSGENQINTTDITPPVGFANGGAYAPLSGGENVTLTLYLATSHSDITSFQIVPRYIGGTPPP